MKTTIEIQNLKCDGCANTIITKLSDIEGIGNVSVDNENNTVTFSHKSNLILIDVKTLLTKLGYPEVGDKMQ